MKQENFKVCPLKVELKSKPDRNWTLHNTFLQTKTAQLPSIRITKCLDKIELESLHNERVECAR